MPKKTTLMPIKIIPKTKTAAETWPMSEAVEKLINRERQIRQKEIEDWFLHAIIYGQPTITFESNTITFESKGMRAFRKALEIIKKK